MPNTPSSSKAQRARKPLDGIALSELVSQEICWFGCPPTYDLLRSTEDTEDRSRPWTRDRPTTHPRGGACPISRSSHSWAGTTSTYWRSNRLCWLRLRPIFRAKDGSEDERCSPCSRILVHALQYHHSFRSLLPSRENNNIRRSPSSSKSCYIHIISLRLCLQNHQCYHRNIAVTRYPSSTSTPNNAKSKCYIQYWSNRLRRPCN